MVCLLENGQPAVTADEMNKLTSWQDKRTQFLKDEGAPEDLIAGSHGHSQYLRKAGNALRSASKGAGSGGKWLASTDGPTPSTSVKENAEEGENLPQKNSVKVTKRDFYWCMGMVHARMVQPFPMIDDGCCFVDFVS